MKYISKYSNGKTVTAAQYITELICENKAKKEKKDLHYKFWTNNQWSKFYRDQIATANKLVKQFNEQAIIKAIKNIKAEKIYSLRAPHLIPIIEEEQRIIDIQNKDLSLSFDRSTEKKYAQNTKTQSILSKLKELE